ncbi:MAG: MoxR family ATPase [Gammaproteobacteria bacterium]
MNSEISSLQQKLADAGYIADRALATTLVLMDRLQRPLLIEGDAGVGKTALAQACAAVHDTEVIRLQCYEGLDVGQAVYEWNYTHQLLSIKMQEGSSEPLAAREAEIFSERFLLARPLLRAITQQRAPVLLIDEIDRADEQFEAFLLEVLSDWQVSVPELGTLRAVSIPRVILTSNATRELSDALRRRCLYFFLDYPTMDKELHIISRRLPGINEQLARQIVSFVQAMRKLDLRKRPGVAETLDWAASLVALEVTSLANNPEQLANTFTCLLKTQEDRQRMDNATVQGLLFKAYG